MDPRIGPVLCNVLSPAAKKSAEFELISPPRGRANTKPKINVLLIMSSGMPPQLAESPSSIAARSAHHRLMPVSADKHVMRFSVNINWPGAGERLEARLGKGR